MLINLKVFFSHLNSVCWSSKQEGGTVQHQRFSSAVSKNVENCSSRLFENNFILQTCKIRLLLQFSLKNKNW